jgi:DNA-binding IclR family transcriptional regulator
VAPRLLRVTRPFLQDLFERTGESVHLAVPAGPDVRFVDGIEGDQPLRVGLRTGARMPAYCTSGGKPMLADLDWSEVEALHPHGLPRWPYAKLRDLPSLRRQLARVRRQRLRHGHDRSPRGSRPGAGPGRQGDAAAARRAQISPMARITRAAAITSAPDLVSTVPAERCRSCPTPRCTKKPPDWARTPTSSSRPASHCMPSE